MARVNGAVLTERDLILISFLGIARYASTEQLHRLVAAGRDATVMYRRLRKLSTKGNRPAEAPCLRRLEYRRAEGTAAPVWALTAFGRSLAESRLPYLRAPARTEVGAQFLLHSLMLNEVLLGLVLAHRRSASSPLAELPFRWLAEDDELLHFTVFRSDLGQARNAVLKPDAILEIPAAGHRLFIEAETGAHSIATADPLQHGAVLRKLERYARFLGGLATDEGPATFYSRAFPDAMTPELLFLVHSDGRKKKVERSAGEWLRAQGLEPFAARVLTFTEAPQVLSSAISGGKVATQAPRVLQLDERRARLLRDGFDALSTALSAARRAVAEHNAICARRLVLPPAPNAELQAFRDVVRHDLLGEPRPPDAATGEGAR